MYTEKSIRKQLDKANQYSLIAEELAKNPIVANYINTILNMQKCMDKAAKMCEDSTCDTVYSTDGSFMAEPRRTPVKLSIPELIEAGLYDQLVQQYPEAVSISASILTKKNDRSVKDLTAYATSGGNRIGVTITDNDYVIKTKEIAKYTEKIRHLLRNQ